MKGIKRPVLILIAVFSLASSSVVLCETDTANNIRWKLVQKNDRRFKIPQIFGYSEKMAQRVNKEIEKATRNLRCDPNNSPREDLAGTEFDVKLKVDLAENDIFSIYATMSYFCGNAYPTNDATFSMTFDLRSGGKVEFEDLFADYPVNKEKILRAIFAAQIEKSDQNNEVKDDGDCAHSGVFNVPHLLETLEYDFTLSPGGLGVQPRWPHVIEACSERVTVPFEKLRSFAKPGGVLERMVQLQRVEHNQKALSTNGTRHT